MNSGQICMSTDRIIIHKSLVEAFIPRYVERVESLSVGDPADPTTIVGPLINTRSAERVAKLVQDAVNMGAEPLTGDGAIQGPNETLIRPVVLTDVTTDMDIYGSEIFGPATVIHPVDSTGAAIDLANDTEYGLTGGVISRDLNAALDVVARIRSGIVHINDQGIGDEPMAPSRLEELRLRQVRWNRRDRVVHRKAMDHDPARRSPHLSVLGASYHQEQLPDGFPA